MNFKNKIDKIFKEELKYPFVVIFAKDQDYYRKPSPGMIYIFKIYFNQNLDFDLNECIYVGDASGRKKSKTYKRNDFSDSNYKFAINYQFKFFTPEEFFLKIKSDYSKIINNLHDDKNINDIKFNSSLDFEEVIMLKGSPGSGKSTYAENFLAPQGYVRINQDNLKTREKIIKALIQNINEKKIIVDGTNPQKDNKSKYINICKKNKYPIRAFVFEMEKEFAMHLNKLRVTNKNRNHYSGYVNKIPIKTFFKNYQKPEIREGFDEIDYVNFIPGPFKNEDDKKLFYLLS